MKLIFTDSHIEESAIEELESIFTEILTYNADEVIFVGDYFEKKRPTSREIIFGTKWAKRLVQKYKKVIFLRGNHDKTENISAIDYLQYLGIKIVNDYIDEDNNYYGHFMTNQSKYEYGTYARTVTELKKYNYVILGHQHSFQELTSKVYHLGSVRYVNFNEVEDNCKHIATLDNELKFIELKSPIPMVDVNSLKELKTIEPKTKIRLIISSFDQFKKEINSISMWKKKFKTFKVKLDFQKTITKEKTVHVNKKQDLQSIINNFINRIEDSEVKKELIKELVKEGHYNKEE